VETGDEVVFQVDPQSIAQVVAMDPIAAYQTHSCLAESLDRGTAAAARKEFGLGDFPAAGKTGTHDGFKDLWFMGYTSAVTCGVWVGFDKQKTIYDGAFASRIPLPIWSDIMNQTVDAFPPREWTPPPDAERVELCKKSGMRATDFCFERLAGADGREQAIRSTYFEYIRPGTRFDYYCTEHVSEGVNSDILSFSPSGLRGSSDSGGGTPGRFNHLQPVRLRGLTILGMDPYKAVQPLPRAIPVEEDGVEARRAEVVEPVNEGGEELPIRLSPPPRIFIEGDKPITRASL
jgi:penicillin-binding protein 1A